MRNYFHQQWVKASRGEGEFECVFVPWFSQDEYTKVAELGGLERFQQEYPCTRDAAFLASVDDVVIKPADVRWAVGREVARVDRGI